jgi:hypothetical protein
VSRFASFSSALAQDWLAAIHFFQRCRLQERLKFLKIRYNNTPVALAETSVRAGHQAGPKWRAWRRFPGRILLPLRPAGPLQRARALSYETTPT